MTTRLITVVIPAVALALTLAACSTAPDQQADAGLNPVAGDASYSGWPGSAYPMLSYEDREAIGRVTYAEAGNQGEEGIAAVIFTILNRLNSGQFGATAQDIVDARNQFEPATRVGGWRYLPPLDPWQSVQFETILNLILAGRLPDLTSGALFFQNAAIVARRAARGKVSSYLVDFGGTPPVAEIGDHRFYDWRAAVNLASWRNRAYDAAAYSSDAAAYSSTTDEAAVAEVVPDETLPNPEPVVAEVVADEALSDPELSAAVAWEDAQSAATAPAEAVAAQPWDEQQCQAGYC